MRALSTGMVLLFVVAACASAPGYFGPDRIPTRESEERHQYQGFAAYPPRGDAWWLRVREQTPGKAIYRREVPGRTHSALCAADLSILPREPTDSEDLAEMVRPTPPDDPERFELLQYSHELVSRQGERCVRFRQVAVDRNAPNSPEQPLHLRDIGWICTHPSVDKGVLRAVFSERGLPEELEPGLEAEAPRCLEAFELEASPGVPAR